MFYFKVLYNQREHIKNRNVPFLLLNENGEPIMDEDCPEEFLVDEEKTKVREDALHSVRFLYYQYEPQVLSGLLTLEYIVISNLSFDFNIQVLVLGSN